MTSSDDHTLIGASPPHGRGHKRPPVRRHQASTVPISVHGTTEGCYCDGNLIPGASGRTLVTPDVMSTHLAWLRMSMYTLNEEKEKHNDSPFGPPVPLPGAGRGVARAARRCRCVEQSRFRGRRGGF